MKEFYSPPGDSPTEQKTASIWDYNRAGLLRAADGRQISLGPYNHFQAPYFECARCTKPICVGERVVVLQEHLVAIYMDNGELAFLPPPDVEGPAFVHARCSPRFCHDQVAQDGGCERQRCVNCDRELEGLCSHCDSRLKGF